jgi:hypothetical protein
MGRKKLAVPWILFGITAIAFVILVLVIAVRDGNASKQQLSIQNADGDSSPNFQDYSKYYARKGYYMRDDGGVSFILEESGEGLITLGTEDEMMFSELKNGDVIIVASDSGVDDSLPPATGAYQCMRIEKGTGDRSFLSGCQEELEELAEMGYTFEDYWRE